MTALKCQVPMLNSNTPWGRRKDEASWGLSMDVWTTRMLGDPKSSEIDYSINPQLVIRLTVSVSIHPFVNSARTSPPRPRLHCTATPHNHMTPY